MTERAARAVYDYAKMCLEGRDAAVYPQNRKAIALIANKQAVLFGWPLL